MILDGMSSLSFCEREGILRTFKIIYLLLNIIRVLVPVIIIIIGTKDLMNAVLQSNTDEMKKSTIYIYQTTNRWINNIPNTIIT